MPASGGRSRVPDEQQTGVPAVGDEQIEGSVLYLENSAVVMPHFAAKVAQVSLDLMRIDQQAASRYHSDSC